MEHTSYILRIPHPVNTYLPIVEARWLPNLTWRRSRVRDLRHYQSDALAWGYMSLRSRRQERMTEDPSGSQRQRQQAPQWQHPSSQVHPQNKQHFQCNGGYPHRWPPCQVLCFPGDSRRYPISLNKFLSHWNQLEKDLLPVNKNSGWYMKGEEWWSHKRYNFM